MAKVTNPLDTFLISKRLGKKAILKKRKEGLTVSFTKPEKSPVFFDPEVKTALYDEITETWNLLTQQQKEDWEEWGEEIGLSGEEFYRIEQKKGFSTGFYNLTEYGTGVYYGVLLTIYSTVYNVNVYGGCTYGK